MWSSVANWYKGWEDEQLAVLRQPELADSVAPGYRRCVARRLATLTAIERQELHDFCAHYRGRNLYLAFLKLCLAFSLAGLLFKFAFLPKMSWWGAILEANLIGYVILVSLVGVWFNYRRIDAIKYRVAGIMLALAMLGGLCGTAVALYERGESADRMLDKLPRLIAAILLVPGAAIGVPLFAITAHRNRRYESLTAQLQAEAERERLARELSESQLRLLRAQIEPHFLFNTLGAVQQLAEQGAPRAAALTADLIDFLRASLSDMRTEQVSLQSEFRLVDSYLRVMQARLGNRLRFELSLPEPLAGVQLPSMLVLTLAENAIKHGIEPSLRGGTVWVGAEDAGSHLRIRVRDSGVGMSATPGQGLGLENVRHRLRLAYGETAGLALYDADPGFEAEITIPQQGARQ